MSAICPPDVAARWQELLRKHDEADIGLAVVVVDPYMGRVVPDLLAMPVLHGHALEEFLQDERHRLAVVKFGRPASELSDEEALALATGQGLGESVEELGPVLGPYTVRSFCEDIFDDPITDAYGSLRRMLEGLNEPAASRALLVDQETNPRLGELWHNGIRDALPDIAQVITALSTGLFEGGPAFNRPPTFSPAALSEKKTVYYSGGGGSGYSQGPYLLMSPSWDHLACLTVTDPDGDDLKIGLGSSPRHGAANVLTSRTGKGKYNVDLGNPRPS